MPHVAWHKGEKMKITRTIVINIYTAKYADGTVNEIRGNYTYASAKSILHSMHPEAEITTVEITQESFKYAMELEDFIKNATLVETER